MKKALFIAPATAVLFTRPAETAIRLTIGLTPMLVLRPAQLVSVAVTLAAFACPVQADYTITPLFDIANFLNPGSINNLGDISYVIRSGGEDSIVSTRRGGPFTTIADTSGAIAPFPIPTPVPSPVPPLPPLPPLRINDSGAVAFRALLDNGDQAVYSARPGAVTPVVDTSGIFSNFHAFTNINNAGTVLFQGTYALGGTAVLTSTAAGIISTIADTRSGSYTGLVSPLSNYWGAINTASDVAYTALLPGGGQAIYVKTAAGALIPIADTSGSFAQLAVATMNDLGQVVFNVEYKSGGRGIYVGNGGALTKIVDVSDGFARLSNPSINNKGAVSFIGGDNATDEAIYIYVPGEGVQRVAGTGDSFLGSTVRLPPGGQRSVFYTPYALNDLDEIVLNLYLSDGREFSALAQPLVVPEPATASLFTVGMLALGAVVGRRRAPRKNGRREELAR